MKNLLKLILLTILLNGCVTHHDYFSDFIINGIILDSATHNRISNAIITFVDVGIDVKRSEMKSKKEICHSDIAGIINCKFRYLWGLGTGFFTEKPSYGYALIVSKDGYDSIMATYNIKEYINKETPILIDLGEAYLKPIK